ncbi:YfiR/HmsC family protein [Tenacibaculum sp. 190524A05c]|uniref:YfiR/HmsC family protein n=1 Tax=Tenacibaculum platacis TaxID=3137852 RepID=UPI0031FB01F9
MIRLKTTRLLIVFTIICSAIQMNAQSNDVKHLQRAIFIFNFAEQVSWKNAPDDQFTIGVLGNDNTITDLKNLAKKRKIKNKPVHIKHFSAIRDVKNVQLVFVKQRYNFDINYLLKKITNHNTLVVTEGYSYNSSMINIINVNNSFAYELNEKLLSRENFRIASSLKKFAITSSDKWKQLYQTTEKELIKAEEKKTEQKELIENKEEQIQSQQKTITVQEKELTVKNDSIHVQTQAIEKLFDENEFQKKKYEEKLLIEKELEKRIQHQFESIKKQKENIKSINSEIETQQKKLNQQAEEIIVKENILKEKDHKLNTQKTINYLLIAVMAFALLITFLIYRSYAAVKRYNKELALKNDKIYKQSIQLESKNKELEQFAHITSHDLKEPLASIFSFANELEENHKTQLDDDGAHYVSFITRASKRGLQFIDALLAYFKLGTSDIPNTEINCNDLVTDITTDLSGLISRNNATVNYSNLPIVNASTIELRLLFQNLINNAIKFKKSDTNPIVSITAQKIRENNNQSKYWQFSVTDNGIGIADHNKEKIFVIFKRLHSKEQYEGTGIGLAYCKKIVESLGGKIWFDSKEGEGTTFHFTLPA